MFSKFLNIIKLLFFVTSYYVYNFTPEKFVLTVFILSAAKLTLLFYLLAEGSFESTWIKNKVKMSFVDNLKLY